MASPSVLAVFTADAPKKLVAVMIDANNNAFIFFRFEQNYGFPP
jgi:hypothetical protein